MNWGTERSKLDFHRETNSGLDQQTDGFYLYTDLGSNRIT